MHYIGCCCLLGPNFLLPLSNSLVSSLDWSEGWWGIMPAWNVSGIHIKVCLLIKKNPREDRWESEKERWTRRWCTWRGREWPACLLTQSNKGPGRGVRVSRQTQTKMSISRDDRGGLGVGLVKWTGRYLLLLLLMFFYSVWVCLVFPYTGRMQEGKFKKEIVYEGKCLMFPCQSCDYSTVKTWFTWTQWPERK